MPTKRIIYLLLTISLLIAFSACGNYAENYREGGVNPPPRASMERRVNRRSIMRNTVRHKVTPMPITRDAMPEPAPRPVPKPFAPQRAVPGRGRPEPRSVAHEPILQDSLSVPSAEMPQRSSSIPSAPIPHNAQSTPSTQNPQNPQATPQGVMPPPTQKPAPTTNPPANPAPNPTSDANKEQPTATQPTSPGKGILATHKTEFNAKDENRATNITRASSSINGQVVKPGETFSYNQTVGPTIERRGYEESTIYVDGEKKKGFGGGVCQVSTTLSIAADNAGMTITERHDHSRPVSYAKEGDEAATSYGGIDFKFKNEKPFPVVINSSVEGGTITVSICEA